MHSIVCYVQRVVAGDHCAERHTPGHAAALVQSDVATSAAGGQFAVKPASHVAVTTATPATGLIRTALPAAAPGQVPSSAQLPLVRGAAAPLPMHKQSIVDASARASAPPWMQQSSLTVAGAVLGRPQQLSVGITPATAPASLSPSQQSAVPASRLASVIGVTSSAVPRQWYCGQTVWSVSACYKVRAPHCNKQSKHCVPTWIFLAE